MNQQQASIRFDDGAAYERLMGRWSLLVADPFLDWIAVPAGRRWLDIGCGNGAFTERLFERCAPASVQAFDPSPAQLDYARRRLPAGTPVTWTEGGAQRLPVADGTADAAVMALVLFFVPEPAEGVAEMVRAVRPGGCVAAYHWDMPGGGFPLATLIDELKAFGHGATAPPSADVSTLAASEALWRDAGLRDVGTRQFTVQRTFANFAEYWDSAGASNTIRSTLEGFDAAQRAALRERVRTRLGAGDAPLTLSARANAVRGTRP